MRRGRRRRGLIVSILVTTLVAAAAVRPEGDPPFDGGIGPALCGGADADTWVIQQAERIRSHDGLFRFSVAEFGSPVECEGIVTQEFDGSKFGKLTFHFHGGATFERETMPPLVVVVTLSRRAGFIDPSGVEEAVRAYTSASGLTIAWDVRERSVDGEVITERFWDPDPGLNASASFTWSAGVLTSVRVAQAP